MKLICLNSSKFTQLTLSKSFGKVEKRIRKFPLNFQWFFLLLVLRLCGYVQQQYRSKWQQVQLQLLPLCVADAAAKQATRKKAQAKIAHNIKHTQLLLYTHTHRYTRAPTAIAHSNNAKWGKLTKTTKRRKKKKKGTNRCGVNSQCFLLLLLQFGACNMQLQRLAATAERLLCSVEQTPGMGHTFSG